MAVSRRDFLKGAATAGLASAAFGVMGCAKQEEVKKEPTIAEKTVWEGETDFIIVGMGAAGLSAAITIGDEKLGSCEIFEVAPEAEAGGNSRCCGQAIFIPSSVEKAIEYQTELNKPYVIDTELMKAWATNICENYDWLEKKVGVQYTPYKTVGEYPEVVGSEAALSYLHNKTSGGQVVWKLLKGAADTLKTVYHYDSRVMSLIKDEEGAVIGITLENGKNYKAHKGVLLAAGGFENSPELAMKWNPAGIHTRRALGSPWNRGDGIRMAEEAGAELWHMNAFSGAEYGFKILDNKKEDYLAPLALKTHDFIWVSSEGKRFMYEEWKNLNRHGKIPRGGTWLDMDTPWPAYAVFSQKCFDTNNIYPGASFAIRMEMPILKTTEDMLKNGVIKKAETIADLAKNINVDATVLEETIRRYNQFCKEGIDRDYGRGDAISATGNRIEYGNPDEEAAKIAKFELEPITAPYYSIEMFPVCLNTQGGPKRSAKGEVMDIKGNPIPRLYSAGEMGTIYNYRYNVGGNFSEAISSGRLAARSMGALTAWDVVPEIEKAE